MIDYQKIIDKYYPADSGLRDIYMRHCRAVADEALEIARRLALPLDPSRIEEGAMLHDIGIVKCDAPSILCTGSEPYIAHGILGRAMLLEEGVDGEIADVAALHTGSGLTRQEVEMQTLPLPVSDYLPKTLLQRLICYADKFYSKSGSMKRKTLEKVREQMARFGDASLARFDKLDCEFNPDSSDKFH